ncbi:MAG: hypothetical protein IJ936_07085, partial [Peptococcaceae bacterium]|nr:hypothetical protein [Peptococcaceae bacterium]
VAKRRPEKETELRDWIGPGRILLGGSTWPGEDEALLRIISDLPEDVKLVIAPRHFEKADAVEENIRKACIYSPAFFLFIIPKFILCTKHYNTVLL